MSSEHIKQMGLIRAGDATKGRPDQFTVIGADISAAELIERFDGNPWAQEVIKALKDRRAERGDPPAFFWMSLRDQGAHTAIRFVNLGNDAKGVPWLVVVDGRNRVLGLRKVNIERQALGQEAFLLKVEILNLPRGKDGIRAHLAALETKTVANISVAMRPSDNADRALDFERMGMSHLDIARKIGIRDEVAADEVPALIALAQCVDEVRAAVDAGTLPLAKCIRLAKRTEDQQRAAVAPKERKPREQRRTLPGEFAKAWAEKLPETFDVAVAALRFMGGDLTALDEYPTLKSAAEKAGLDFETGRVKRTS
jgi:hypothetical protein